MSEELYHRIRRATNAGPIPASELAPLVLEVEEATSQKAPLTLAQRRTFLANWADDQKGKYSEPPPVATPVRASPRVASPKNVDLSARSPPKGKSKVMNSPPQNPPPAAVAHTPPEGQKSAPVMDREMLLRTLYMYKGRQIPSAQLGSLSSAIQALNPDGPKAPSTVAQKRTYIDDWFATHGADYVPPPESEEPPMPPPGGRANVAHSPRDPEADRRARMEEMQQRRQQQAAQQMAAQQMAAQQQQQQQQMGPSLASMASLTNEIRRAYTSGATEQQLHALASAVAVSNGLGLPAGGAGDWAEFVLDFHNWARHALEPKPAALPRPKSGAGSTGGGPEVAQLQRQLSQQRDQLQQAEQQMALMAQQLQQAQQQAQQMMAMALPPPQMGGGGGGGGGMAFGHAMSPNASPSPTGHGGMVAPPPPVMAQISGGSGGSGSPGGGGGGGMADGSPGAWAAGPPGGIAPPPPMGDADATSLKTPRDKGGLLSLLERLTGGDPDRELPLAALQEVTKHVATISRKAAPKLIQQKRAFVRGWHDEQRKLHGLAVGVGSYGGGGGGAPSPALANLTPDSVFQEVDARLTQAQRSITQSELADFHVDALAEQIAALVRIEVPTMMRDRRALVNNWHAQQKRMRMGGSGGPGGMRGMPTR